ncbi:hypothetical protein LRC484719_03390 [Mycobacterium riyadhense]
MLRGALAEQTLMRRKHPGMHARYDRADPIRIACMVNFEAVLLHARILNDFLTVEPRYPDDAWAGDFIVNWQPPNPSPLKRIRPLLREQINKQLAHFSLKRVGHKGFPMDQIVNEVMRDMGTFANDTTNVCHAELAGVRTLLTRSPWPTV